LKKLLGGGSEARGYQNTMGLFAIVAVGLFLFTFNETRERVAPPPDQRQSLARDLKELFSNRPWWVLICLAVFTLANAAIRSGSTLYYFKYYVGDVHENLSPWFLGANALAMMAGASATGILARRFTKKNLMIWLSLLNAVSMAAFYVIPHDQFWLMMVVNIVGTLLAGPTPGLVWSMYGDVADFGEWKFGRRATGLVVSAATFAQKLGWTIGGGVGPWLLYRTGYVANAAQSPSAIVAIKLVFAIFPAVLGVLCALTMVFYPLDDAQVLRIEADLAARKAAVVS
jgi:GPH family glycoside/pentoside/hexuronide:cation symporter